jgi:hypothetical protein
MMALWWGRNQPFVSHVGHSRKEGDMRFTVTLIKGQLSHTWRHCTVKQCRWLLSVASPLGWCVDIEKEAM